jgi:hypothetical protein
MNPSQTPLTIDGALYPDVDPPKILADLTDRIDFLARLCAAWDFGRSLACSELSVGC